MDLPRRFLGWSALALIVPVCFSVLTISARERWPLALWQAGLFSLAAVWAVRMLVRPYRLHGCALLPFLVVCCLWSPGQLLAGGTACRLETAQVGLCWAAYLVLFAVALQVFSHGGLREAALRALALFGFAVAAEAVVQLFTSNGKIFWIFTTGYTNLVLGPFAYHNNYAAFIELVLPLAIWEALKRRQALVFWVAAGVMFASVIASGSRAGSALAALEIAFLFLLGWMRRIAPRRKLLLAAAKLAVLAGFFAAVVGWGYIWGRLQQRDPYAIRRELLHSSLAMAREKPWTGFGLGTWPLMYPAYATFDNGAFVNHAHNDWAEWAGEGGLPFVLCMACVAAWAIRQSVRFPWGLGVSSVFLHSLVDYPMQKPALAALTFLLLAAIAGAHVQAKNDGKMQMRNARLYAPGTTGPA
jgi:O-antigen ligase